MNDLEQYGGFSATINNSRFDEAASRTLLIYSEIISSDIQMTTFIVKC